MARSQNHHAECLSLLLVTANLGTLFEMAEEIMEDWIDQFIHSVVVGKPEFIALHCQEMGGKKCTSATMQLVEHFTKSLLGRREICGDYDRAHVFIDKQFDNAETFTALGNYYLARRSLPSFDIWDYHENAYIPVTGHNVTYFQGDENVDQARKSRFPVDLHPLAKGNRKGYLKVRCRLNATAMDFFNVHMFYDEDNFVAMEAVPSQYTEARKSALRYILDRQCSSSLPFFIFGDFNFRLDVHDVVKALTANGIRQEILTTCLPNSHTDPPPKARICFVENDELNKLILTVEKKMFDHHDRHDYAFQVENGKWLRAFDNELEAFREDICEFDINFAPSYPYVEDKECGRLFMKTRCPAWCDRILMSHSARQLMSAENAASIQYDMIGASVCMGDHKPVFLSCRLSHVPKQFSTLRSNNHVAVESGSVGSDKADDKSSSKCSCCAVL